MNSRHKISKLALQSRLVIIVLQYISNRVLEDHDAGTFKYPTPQNRSTTILDNVVHHLLGGFLRWDAQYFMNIASYGYTYENVVAFFPLWPLLARGITMLVPWASFFMNLDTLLLMVFTVLNVFLFVKSALALYDLTAEISGDKFAFLAGALFCINPASVFFVAPYSECLFSLLTFKTMHNCVLLHKKCLNSGSRIDFKDISLLLPIMLSGVTRSNGLLNIGFLVYTLVGIVFLKLKTTTALYEKVALCLKYLLLTCFGTAICITPFALYQYYCYKMFCTSFTKEQPNFIESYASLKDFVMPGNFDKYNQTWCYNKIPLAYSYVQNHYWEVGFLKYYSIKQIPNFLLAFPILFIFLSHTFNYLQINCPKNISQIFDFYKSDNFLFVLPKNDKKKCSILKLSVLVFIVHGLFLSILCIFFVHIQVSTRLLCSGSPLLYWFCAKYFFNEKRNQILTIIPLNLNQKLILVYFLSYCFVGIFMFCNFLPWT